MERVIKFRAWHDSGKMLFVGDDFGTTHNLDCCRYAECKHQGKHITLMQFTGLVDKNGVEIYEGDVVRWGHVAGYEELVPRIATVEMDVDLSFMTVNLGNNNHRFRYGNFMYKNTHQAMEVIGNIHQNPELLERLS